MADWSDQKAKKGMTKGAARTHLNAARKAMKRVQHAIRHGQVGHAKDWAREAIMELSIIEGANIQWNTTCPRVVEGGRVCGLRVGPGYVECLPHRGPNAPWVRP